MTAATVSLWTINILTLLGALWLAWEGLKDVWAELGIEERHPELIPQLTPSARQNRHHRQPPTAKR